MVPIVYVKTSVVTKFAVGNLRGKKIGLMSNFSYSMPTYLLTFIFLFKLFITISSFQDQGAENLKPKKNILLDCIYSIIVSLYFFMDRF